MIFPLLHLCTIILHRAFADNKINVTEKLKFVLERVENIVGNGENAENQHFLLFPLCFQKASFLRLLKVGIVCYRLNTPSSSALTETRIMYTDGHTDKQTHRWTDRMIPVYPKKTFLLPGYNNPIPPF